QRVFPLEVVQALRGITTDCETEAERLERAFRSRPGVYFRFNVAQDLQGVELSEWDRLGAVRSHTEQYLATMVVDQKLEGAVNVLRGGRVL
ncbi:uncharacterized protein EV420DRAFT_1276233, partial [Desarmillaria tabescens]